ncbi:MAG: DUF3301 domain-containing protein [Chromatiaceae bacterium]|nr:DUF3301 domain-containing protein [Chromatiaceae bacterium]
MSYFVLLSIFFGLAWLWLDGARARELAIGLAKSYCEKHDLQFLDETVALSRMAPRWTNQGIRIRRMFRFDFSLEGVGRRTGYVLMLGTRLETIDDGLEEPPTTVADDVATKPADDGASNVVPFKRKDR